MRYYLIFVVLIFTISCTMSQTHLTEKQFTKEYYNKSLELNPEVKYRVIDELHLESIFEGNPYQHYLDNAYAEYKMEPMDLDSVLVKYIKAAGDLYEPNEDVDVNRIVPIIKDKDYISDVKASLAEKGGELDDSFLVYQQYNEELTIVFAEDRTSSIKYFSQAEFEKTGLPFDSLLSTAVKNLVGILPDIRLMDSEGYYGVLAGGDYEASLILLKSLWTKENFQVQGDIVISIPSRDLVFVTGSENDEGLEQMRQSIQEVFETGNYLISTQKFIWTGEKFMPFINED